MNYSIDWSAKRFNDDLLNVQHWQDAANICAAIKAFASSGVGDVRRIEAAPGNERVLHVGAYRVRLRLEPLGKR